MDSVTFKSLGLDSSILKALDGMGFEKPTEIQEKAIPLLMKTEGDFIGQAQTGTGKTGAFVIPLLEKLDPNNDSVQALILAPTRELANQVEKEIVKIGKYTGIKSTTVYGGTGYEKQMRALRNDKPQIVVGTPGRVIDMINKKILKLSNASFCVLDEADEMLNMGFLDDVKTILGIFKEDRQLVMFSATMPKEILKLIDSTFNAYEMVKIAKKTLSNANIEQKYSIVRERHMREALARIIDSNKDMYGIVFCKTKIETKEVGDELKKRGHDVEVLNGDMGQYERDHAMRCFKEKKANIMVCTDVAARGIDVNNLTHVINYGLPQNNESYVHRIGRTGRAGSTGIAYTLIGPKMNFAMRKLEKHINQKIKLVSLPSVIELKKSIVQVEVNGAKQIFEAIQAKGEAFKTDNSFEIFKDEFGDLTQDELLKLMFTWKFNKMIRHYDNLSDIEVSASEARSGGGGGRGRSDRMRRRGPRVAGSSDRSGRSRSGGGSRRSRSGDDRSASGSRRRSEGEGSGSSSRRSRSSRAPISGKPSQSGASRRSRR